MTKSKIDVGDIVMMRYRIDKIVVGLVCEIVSRSQKHLTPLYRIYAENRLLYYDNVEFKVFIYDSK